jgi:hypothetical protein
LDEVAASVMVTKFQEQLPIQERELDSRENIRMAREDDLAATERALGRACVECDAECDRLRLFGRTIGLGCIDLL